MVNYAISKNIHVETAKEHFSTSFFYFALFLKIVFLGIKNQFSAFSSPIELKIFLMRLQVIWVGRFFFGSLIPMKFVRLRKILKIQKTRQILLLQPEVFGIFEKKNKNAHSGWVRLPTIKISAQMDKICGFGGRRNFLT